MKITTVVAAGSSRHKFVAYVRRSFRREHLALSLQDFYLEFAGIVPEGEHYELEVIEPNGEALERSDLHLYHCLVTDRPFVCYPKQIPNLVRAQEVFEMWCLVVTCVVTHGVDLNTIFGRRCRGKEDMFLAIMGTEYNVSIVGSTIEGEI